ncbi:MAG: methyltransferase domain-containing protein [Pirellulaceae bacterium]
MALRVYRDDDDLPEEHLLGQFIPLHYHFNMLQDEARVGAFREAIAMVVKPGMKVLELGGGTGILSYLAARRGAQVWCVERNPELAETARRLLVRNRVADRVEVIKADALVYLPPEPVDVVICEMLHVGLLREKQVEVLESFKRRYREAFGEPLPRFVPDSSLLAVQPVEQSFEFFGYDAPVPMFQAPAAAHEGTRPLAELTAYASVFYDEPTERRFRWSGDVTVEASGRATAFRFTTQNLLAFDAERRLTITWPNQFLVLPLEGPLSVSSGRTLRIGFDYTAGDPIRTLAASITAELTAAASRQRRAA